MSDGKCEVYDGAGKDCTIRDAVDAANARSGSDTIDFTYSSGKLEPVATYPGRAEVSIAGPVEDLNATGDLDAWDDNSGTTLTISGTETISGVWATSKDRILHTPTPPSGKYTVDLVLSGVSVTFGSVSNEPGGCILAGPNSLTITGGVFASCNVTNTGTTKPGGGAIAAEGPLTMTDSEVSQNTVARGHGGGVYATDEVTLDNTEVDGNVISFSGNGGGLYVDASDTLSTSDGTTFYDNVAPNYGGGAYVDASEATFEDTEFEANQGATGGGLYMVAFTPSGTTFNRTSFVGNYAPNNGGGGMYIKSGTYNPTLVIRNSTFSANTTCSGCVGAGLWVDETGSKFNVDVQFTTFAANVRLTTPVWTAAPLQNDLLATGTGTVDMANSLVEGKCTGLGTFATSGGNTVQFGITSPDHCGATGGADQHLSGGWGTLVGLAYNGELTRQHEISSWGGGNTPVDFTGCSTSLTTDSQNGATRAVGSDCDSGSTEQ